MPSVVHIQRLKSRQSIPPDTAEYGPASRLASFVFSYSSLGKNFNGSSEFLFPNKNLSQDPGQGRRTNGRIKKWQLIREFRTFKHKKRQLNRAQKRSKREQEQLEQSKREREQLELMYYLPHRPWTMSSISLLSFHPLRRDLGEHFRSPVSGRSAVFSSAEEDLVHGPEHGREIKNSKWQFGLESVYSERDRDHNLTRTRSKRDAKGSKPDGNKDREGPESHDLVCLVTIEQEKDIYDIDEPTKERGEMASARAYEKMLEKDSEGRGEMDVTEIRPNLEELEQENEYYDDDGGKATRSRRWERMTMMKKREKERRAEAKAYAIARKIKSQTRQPKCQRDEKKGRIKRSRIAYIAEHDGPINGDDDLVKPSFPLVVHYVGRIPLTIADCIDNQPILVDEWGKLVDVVMAPRPKVEEALLYNPNMAQEVMDFLQAELDRGCSERYHNRCMKLMNLIVRHYGILPRSHFCNGVRKTGSGPISLGASSDTWEGQHDGRPVCIKAIRHFLFQENEFIKTCYREAFIWRQLRHENILPFIGMNDEFSPNLWLISPWMKNGNISDFLKSHPSHNVFNSVIEITRGLRYLHHFDPPIIHWDLRGANVLVGDDYQCMLADFGLSHVVTTKAMPTSYRNRGTDRWLAPEMWDRKLFSEKYICAIDIYALGCTMIELYTRKVPYAHVKIEIQIIFEIFNKYPQPQEVPPELWVLVEGCLSTAPKARPSIDRVLQCLEAQLAAFSRQYKASDSYDSDAEGGDELAKVPSAFLTRVVSLLVDEREDELKELMKDTYGMDDQTVEHNVLDLMHKHRDDVAGVPFLFLTPTRRPISRPSSRASTPSARLPSSRPETSSSAPSSPLAQIFRRPLLTSPLSGGHASSYMSARSEYSASPTSSPILSHAHATHIHAQFTASLPASPLSSPRLLNAKASEFKPIPRPLSAASSNPGPGRSESPDLWAHSPFRATSNLAIAAPLLPDQPNLSRSTTPVRSPLRNDTGDDDDDDPFDPFGPNNNDHPPSFQVSDFDTSQWEPEYSSINQSLNPYAFEFTPPYLPSEGSEDALGMSGMANSDGDPETDAAFLTNGMTPFDVLSSVFGSTLAPSELEEALAENSYDFERSMAWLVDRTLPQQQQPGVTPQRMQPMGGRVTLVSRGGFPIAGPPNRPNPIPNARFGANGRPAAGGNRVCRYFVAGECLRADCHDLERALCRFWLRGTCAKGESCEFLHHLPKDVDVQGLGAILARANINPNPNYNNHHHPQNGHNPPLDDFPVLGQTNGLNDVAGGGLKSNNKRNYAPGADAGRTRFATAVKKPPQASSSLGLTSMVPGTVGANGETAARREALETLNNLYMTYRSRALQLGQARNACLSRAADAWRRGDGASAKRFSREGHELNGKMSAEMKRAAGELVRERARELGARGKLAGAGLGVILGVAGSGTGDGKLSVEERTEVALDLHGLHANEATEVLEEFLLALEAEFFYGLAYVIVGCGEGCREGTVGYRCEGVDPPVGYPWSERDGIICVDPLTHAEE
ncbi:hypothetical protein BDP27DRAFT_1356857 [Rhodocollybia butyracea]|uniref:Non-specific serine/threonine protein kinase n=1 Tax=Rhodocollybia butyracea TaxID=206335 RepID=A0A9P5UGA6_9AGAR|nr:hypothetical protein BDP27DRAFT_1356857 [Rhodocollybia butyracea]